MLGRKSHHVLQRGLGAQDALCLALCFFAEGLGREKSDVLHRGWGARQTLLGLAERLGALDEVCLADRLGALDTLCLADGLQRGWGRKTHYALQNFMFGRQ